MGSGEWQVASGEWQVASGEWQVASGEWHVASGPNGHGQWLGFYKFVSCVNSPFSFSVLSVAKILRSKTFLLSGKKIE